MTKSKSKDYFAQTNTEDELLLESQNKMIKMAENIDFLLYGEGNIIIKETFRRPKRVFGTSVVIYFCPLDDRATLVFLNLSLVL